MSDSTPQPEKWTHLLRVVFATGNGGTFEHQTGWVAKPQIQRSTADGLIWAPDPSGDTFVESNPKTGATMEIHYAHGGKLIMARANILFYETKSTTRMKAEQEAFKERMSAADERVADQVREARQRRDFQG